jgi:hypothetical protein
MYEPYGPYDPFMIDPFWFAPYWYPVPIYYYQAWCGGMPCGWHGHHGAPSRSAVASAGGLSGGIRQFGGVHMGGGRR